MAGDAQRGRIEGGIANFPPLTSLRPFHVSLVVPILSKRLRRCDLPWGVCRIPTHEAVFRPVQLFSSGGSSGNPAGGSSGEPSAVVLDGGRNLGGADDRCSTRRAARLLLSWIQSSRRDPDLDGQEGIYHTGWPVPGHPEEPTSCLESIRRLCGRRGGGFESERGYFERRGARGSQFPWGENAVFPAFPRRLRSARGQGAKLPGLTRLCPASCGNGEALFRKCIARNSSPRGII